MLFHRVSHAARSVPSARSDLSFPKIISYGLVIATQHDAGTIELAGCGGSGE
jgi:hypothetical protein